MFYENLSFRITKIGNNHAGGRNMKLSSMEQFIQEVAL